MNPRNSFTSNGACALRRALVAPIAASVLLVSGHAEAQEAPPVDPQSTAGAPEDSASAPATATSDTPVGATASADAALVPPSADAQAATSVPTRRLRYTATVGVASLPRVLALDLMVRIRRKTNPDQDLFAIGVGLEDLPRGIASFGSAKLSWLVAGADFRWFPWRWLYVGTRIGYQWVKTDSEKFGAQVAYTTESLLLAPNIGVLHSFDSGLTLAAGLGAGIPLGAQTTLSSDGTADSYSRKIDKTFGTFVMPFLALRAGYTL